MANELINVNSLIIPMDETYQNSGMYKAYGLVYSLLKNGIPVKWSIQPGKAYGGTDFTASSIDIQSLTPISNYNYNGGPFIITDTYASAAITIITAWQTLNPGVKVHRATSSFNAPIAATMNRAPRIAVEETNSDIIIGYLNAAGIPDSKGNPWPKTSQDILSPTEVGQGAFFGYNTTDPCRKLVYDIFLSPHTSDSTWSNTTNKGELDLYLKTGGVLHATCHSISAIENVAGPFLTASGISSFPNKGDDGSFTVDLPDFPSAQAIQTSGAVQKLPGGSEQTWLHTSVTYNAETSLLAHFTNSGRQYDFMIAGTYKNGTGAGKIVYEGGHEYATTLPYSKNGDGPYLRFVLDSVLFSVAKPWIYLTSSPATLNQGLSNTITFAVKNDGGSLADNVAFSVTLEPGLSYNGGSATIPPDSIVGQTLTWNSTTLLNKAPGTILTFTAVYTPSALGITRIATFSTSYTDTFNTEKYNLQYCISTTVIKAGNLPPTVPDYDVLTAMNTPVSGTVVGTDPNGDPLTYSLLNSPGSGSVIVNSNGNWTYTPNANYIGNDSFSVLVDDGNGGTAISQIRVGILAAQIIAVKSVDKPSAKTGDVLTYTINLTNTGNTSALGVFFTDPFPPDTTLIPDSFTINGTPQIGVDPSSGVNIGNILVNGSVNLTFQVKVTGIPVPPVFQNEAFLNFTYQIIPGGETYGGSSSSNKVSTAGVNSPPIVPDYNVTTPINTPVSGTIVGTDPDGNPLTYTLNTSPTNGNVLVNSDGTWTYTPDTGFTGVDKFTVTVSDGMGGSAISTVTINVNAPKFNPVKSASATSAKAGDVITYTINITNTGSVPANNVVLTDNIPLGTSFVSNSVTVNGSPVLGVSPLTGISIGTISVGVTVPVTFKVNVLFRPDPATYIDEASINYVYQAQPGGPVLNGSDKSNILIITALNNPPTVPDYTVNTPVNTPVSGIVVGNDVDPTDTLTYSLNTPPAHGGTVVNPNGSYTYTPNLDYIGTDTFTVLVSDGHGGTAVSTITVNINAPSLSFLKNADKTEAKAGDTITYTFTIKNNGNVTANNVIFTDNIPSGTTFVQNSFMIGNTVIPGANPSLGVNILNITAGSTVIVSFEVHVNYRPTPPEYTNTGELNYEYKADPNGPIIKGNKDSNTVTVIALNNPPTVPDYTVTTPLNTPVSGVVIGNDVDLDTLTYSLNSLPANGVAIVNSNGNWTYTPNLSFIGTDSFKVLVSDGHGGTAISTVTINVNGANLDAVKSADKTEAKANDIITYTITIKNTGNVTALNVIFKDTPPLGTSFISNSFTVDNSVKPGADPSIGVNVGSIDALKTKVISFKVLVNFKPISNFYINESSMDYTYKPDPNGPTLPGSNTSNKISTIALNNPPTVPDYHLVTNINTQVSGLVVGSDVDPGDVLTYSLNTAPMHGTATVNPTGSFTYTPATDYLGIDTFTVLVKDGNGGTAISTITININAPRISMVKSTDKTEAYVGDTITYTTVIKNTGTADAKNVIFKDNPPLGTSFIINSFKLNGVVISNTNPSLGVNIGTISVNSSVTVEFKVKVNTRPSSHLFINKSQAEYEYVTEPNGSTFTGSVASNEITTEAKNTPPTVPNYEVVTEEDTPVSGTVVGHDVNGDPLTYMLNTPPANGTAIVNLDGTWSYSPNKGFCGTDMFTVLVSDGEDGSAISTITITIKPPICFKQFSIMEDLEIPSVKPDAEDIIDVNCDVVIVETNIIKTPISTSYEGQRLTGYKVIVEGKIVQKIEYIANDDVQSVHAAEFEMPFSSFIVLPPCYKLGTPVTVQGVIEDVYFSLLDSRHIFKNITLRIEASVNV